MGHMLHAEVYYTDHEAAMLVPTEEMYKDR